MLLELIALAARITLRWLLDLAPTDSRAAIHGNQMALPTLVGHTSTRMLPSPKDLQTRSDLANLTRLELLLLWPRFPEPEALDRLDARLTLGYGWHQARASSSRYRLSCRLMEQGLSALTVPCERGR